MFQAFGVLPFVAVSIGPGEDAITCEHSLAPLAFIGAAVGVAEGPLATEVTIFEVTLIDTGLTDIVTITLFDSIPKIALIIRPIAELLHALAVWLIPLPTSTVLVILIRIDVISFSLCLSILDLALIVTPIVENIPSLYRSLPRKEEALIVCPILKEKFPFAVEFIILPFAMIVPLWCQ